ncbi:bifunctional isocitrate dehydrogenase kinase/phosphatase [Anaerolineales bacterium HSG6]|nr:bifunctional isocitrate dehydrogenase kinase/phosphatase [Anaerolineales bacterium HSG6]MDM8532888.1 bifunctional isocitrate dehydrogenase kinase/phosphatase [Anaerolineales bacterium HSG25]
MTALLTDSRRANLGAKVIHKAFDRYQFRFKEITLKAKVHFEKKNLHDMQTDAELRLDLYKQIVQQVVPEIHELLGDRINEKLLWVSIKAVYSGRIDDRNDWELAETFFNSVTRQIFTTVGVDPQIEFVDTDFDTPPTPSKQTVYHTYEQVSTIDQLIRMILSDYSFQAEYAHFDEDTQLAANRIKKHLISQGNDPFIKQIETLKSIFYRGQAAYIIGCIHTQAYHGPLAIALHYQPEGIVIDAVLLTEDEVSILFSFAHSSFHIHTSRPYDLVQFLHQLMPRKKIGELYISLGFNKHGKTELYRDLLYHLANSDDQFEIARGERGMVMIVFAMPSYDVVIKIIKDTFAYPKDSTRGQVMEKYHFVFRHDRAGRLVDAQEFEHLKFERKHFSDDLLAELINVAAQMVTIDGDDVIIDHAYIQRRLIPLNIYLREAETEKKRAAVIDYGQAIKDLMTTNIFPGDLLLKNFGVTRHGRVVFYDYDELCLLTDCKFRRIPPARNYEDELSDIPWFSVGENDVFPEQFPSFLGLREELRRLFVSHHQDLFDVKLWKETQNNISAGSILKITPYKRESQLR